MTLVSACAKSQTPIALSIHNVDLAAATVNLTQPDTPLGHYIEKVAPFAQAEQRDSGVPASYSIAQSIHESWIGSANVPSILATQYNNYHGIKCSEPKELPCVQVRNAGTGGMDSWNSYSSGETGFIYHGRWLKQNGNYSNAFNHTEDSLAFAREVLRCYTGCNAPFPQSYYDDIVRLVNDYDLRQYDVQKIPGIDLPPIVSPKIPGIGLPPIVLPKIPNPIDDIRKQIDKKIQETKDQLTRQVEDYIRSEIEKFVQREAERIVQESCGSSAVALALAALVALNRKRKM